MKKFTLSMLTLAIAISIVPASLYPVDISKDGVTIRVTNEQDRSEKLKSHNLACFYMRIKNGTHSPLELPKYAVSGSIIAHEKALTEIIDSLAKESGKYLAKFIIGTGIQLAPSLALGISGDNNYYGRNAKNIICNLAMIGCITSPITGLAWAIPPYCTFLENRTILQQYLDRKATTLHIGGEYGFHIYINLDEYQRSIDKNITLRLHKKDSDQVIIFEINTIDLMQTLIA